MDSRHSGRKDFYPLYKSHREDRKEKSPVKVQKVMDFQDYIREDISLRIIEFDELEADDLVALFVQNYKTDVMAIDKDLLQISGIQMHKVSNDPVTLENFIRRQPKGIQGFIKQPRDVLVVLCLLGDSSDDVPRILPVGQIPLLARILSSPDPFQVAYELYGDSFLTNYYLTALPGPWVYDPHPDPKSFFEERDQKRVLRRDISHYLSEMEESGCLQRSS